MGAKYTLETLTLSRPPSILLTDVSTVSNNIHAIARYGYIMDTFAIISSNSILQGRSAERDIVPCSHLAKRVHYDGRVQSGSSRRPR